jgi:hypothetical protein
MASGAGDSSFRAKRSIAPFMLGKIQSAFFAGFGRSRPLLTPFSPEGPQPKAQTAKRSTGSARRKRHLMPVSGKRFV